jgi:hypothetical protein
MLKHHALEVLMHFYIQKELDCSPSIVVGIVMEEKVVTPLIPPI